MAMPCSLSPTYHTHELPDMSNPTLQPHVNNNIRPHKSGKRRGAGRKFLARLRA